MEVNLLHRLSSFLEWPSDVPVSPVILANAGFKYTGCADKVTCPVCRIEIEGWRTMHRAMDPRNEHVTRSPHCSLALACLRSSDDDETSSSRKITLGDLSSRQNELHSGTATNRQSANADPDSLSRANNPHGNSHSTVPHSLGNGALKNAQTAEFSSIDFDRHDNPDFHRLKIESVRLNTFHDWPREAHVQPSELAADGWFYTGRGDRVCCAFCRGILHQWAKNDRPASEHRKFFPNCAFIKGRNVGNVPLATVTGATAAVAAAAAETATGPGADFDRGPAVQSLSSTGGINNNNVTTSMKSAASGVASKDGGSGVSSPRNCIDTTQHLEVARTGEAKDAEDDYGKQAVCRVIYVYVAAHICLLA